MKTIYFALAIHNHQPIGNFDQIFEEACQKAYLPFLDVLEASGMRMAMHYSGCLLNWLIDHDSDLLERVRGLVSEGRLEMMTGGYYEPILPIIPDCDKLGQIGRLTEVVKKRFDYDPKGMWLAERVWEPHLPMALNQAGVKYILIDDSHFITAGLEPEQMFGYYLTEEQGYPLAIFPISKMLRYTIPFRPVRETIDYLRDNATEAGDRIAVMGDDGEKFGIWPKTHESVYGEGWLEAFFKALSDNRDWIKVVTPWEYMERHSALGRVYLPAASYIEMMEWALPAESTMRYEDVVHQTETLPFGEQCREFLRGGFWRNYLAKYDESNNMHKKMLEVSRRVHALPEVESRTEALDELWQGQCNCSYWHGVFGGLYLNNIRSSVYEHLLRAETLADRVHHVDSGWIETETGDFQCDGGQVLLLRSAEQDLYIDVSQGAALYEWDLKGEPFFNLTNTLTRRLEAYHRKVIGLAQRPPGQSDGVQSIHDTLQAKESGLETHLQYDWYRKSSLIDHFLNEAATLETFARAAYPENGDFVNRPYTCKLREGKDCCSAAFQRKGALYLEGGPVPVQVFKTLTVPTRGRGFHLSYRIINCGSRPVKTRFGPEFNFSLLAGDTEDRYYLIPGVSGADRLLGSTGSTNNVSKFAMVEEWLGLRIVVQLDQPATLWRCPVETVSNSEAGFERVYQASTVLPHWPLELEPGEARDYSLTVVVVHS